MGLLNPPPTATPLKPVMGPPFCFSAKNLAPIAVANLAPYPYPTMYKGVLTGIFKYFELKHPL